MSDDTTHQNLLTAIEKLKQIERARCFDAFNPTSVPTEKQEQVFRDIADITSRYVVAGNQSGKSQMGAREVSWIFEHQHPYWDTKKEFGDTPLLILVMGRVGEQVETELWSRKIKPFLTPGTYKEIRTGNSLQRVQHLENKNTIVFLSHHNVNEARQKAQAYTASYVWLDEMPASHSLITELVLRVQANRGRMLATFTPLLREPIIKDMIETAEAPVGRKYQFNMLDNPIYKGREEELLRQFAGIPEDERRARLYGEWFKGGDNVYEFSPEQRQDPEGYHPSWPHVEVVDPAASGKAGYMLLANKPGTASWYVVKVAYIKGAAASDLIDEISRLTAGCNVMRRVSDPHETWFIKEAAKHKLYYCGVFNKKERKHELIKNLQSAINDRRLIITNWVPEFEDELTTCMWKTDSVDKIIGASRFHLLDCAQYGVDNLPKIKEDVQVLGFEAQMRKDHKKRKEVQAKVAARVGRMKRGRRWK